MGTQRRAESARLIRLALILVLTSCGRETPPTVDPPDAPTGIRATDGEIEGLVEVWWVPVTGATHYEIHRDGALIAGDVTAPPFIDDDAIGSRPSAEGLSVTASQGIHTDAVVVDWQFPVPVTTGASRYAVVAVNETGAGPPSDEVEGRPGEAPVMGFEIQIDDGPWFPVPGTSYEDLHAPAGDVDPGIAEASQGSASGHVRLTAQGASATDLERNYSVRAVSRAGPGEAAEPVVGWRAVGELSFGWERSTGDDPEGPWIPIEGSGGPVHHDVEAPRDGEGRYYRCRVSLGEGAVARTPPVRGHRYPSPSARPRPDVWGVFGEAFPQVAAVAVHDDILYLGGVFEYVGPVTGGSARVGLDAPATPDLSWPQVRGDVNALVPDGDGGWYVGGRFTRVGETPADNLARITASGTVDPGFRPAVDGEVYALALAGDRLYVGGEFERIDGVLVDDLATVDAATGALLDWNPAPDGRVEHLALAGGILFAGGRFHAIGEDDQRYVASFDLETGALRDWDPDVGSPVEALAVSETHGLLFMSGTLEGGSREDRLVAFDVATGSRVTWSPSPDEIPSALEVHGDRLYVGGRFDEIAGAEQHVFAAFDLPGLSLLDVKAPVEPMDDGRVTAIVAHGGVVYLAGDGLRVEGGEPRHTLAFGEDDGEPLPWHLAAHGAGVQVLRMDGDALLLGGAFESVGGVPRANAAAIDLATGRATDWAPEPDGRIDSLLVAGDRIFMGGAFDTVGSEPRRHLAAVGDDGVLLDPDFVLTGTTNASVRALALHDGVLFAGGHFVRAVAGGEARTNLVAFDPMTGELVGGGLAGWTPDPSAVVYALAVTDERIFAGGDFLNVADTPRTRLAAFDRTSGTLLSGTPAAGGGAVRSLILRDGAVWVGGTFSDLGGIPGHSARAFDAATYEILAWAPPLSDSRVFAVAADGDRIYLGGDHAAFTHEGVAFHASAALAESAEPASWAPQPKGTVRSVHASEGRVVLGGFFDTVDRRLTGRIAVFEP